MNNTPLISVFIPYYNDEKYLKYAIKSVLNQTYPNFELILLNHASTDSSQQIAHSFRDERIKHVDMDINYGAGGGILFDRMLKESSGKYIKPFCADDIMRNDCLQQLLDYMETHPQIDFAFGNVEYIDDKDEDLKENWFHQRPGFSIKDNEVILIRKYAQGISVLPYIGSIVKREKLLNIKINKTYVMLFDMSLWISLLCTDNKIGYLNKLVCNYRIHDGQVSALKQNSRSSLFYWFETKTFYEYFLNITNIELVKKIWPESRFIKQLKYKEDIPFFIAHNMFITRCPFEAPAAYLYHLFEDESATKRLKNHFNYSIRELRKDILSFESEVTHEDLSHFQIFKNRIYVKPSKFLGLGDIAFLMLRRIFYIIKLEPLRKKLREKKKQKYSL